MVQCRGFAKSGWRCKNQGTYADGYCYWHTSLNLCRGDKLDGVKCLAKQRPGFLYCRADHDPAQRQLYMNPNLLRLPGLRKGKIDDIVQLYNHKDAYNCDTLPSAYGYRLGSDYELDHKFELQAAAHAVREARIYDTEEREIVNDFLRNNVLNENANLCVTLKIFNATKGVGLSKLLEDRRVHGANVLTFTGYMKAAAADKGTHLRREVTLAIRTEVKEAAEFCQYKLEDESDTPSFARVSRQFKALRIAMRD